MGKSTISMAIFDSYLKLPEGRFDDQRVWYNKKPVEPVEWPRFETQVGMAEWKNELGGFKL